MLVLHDCPWEFCFFFMIPRPPTSTRTDPRFPDTTLFRSGGRLDLNAEGLLLLTTDGGLKRQMELPSTVVERTYRARAYGEVSQAQLEDLIEGIEIEGIRYGKIDANLERRTGRNQWKIGRAHV